jgi:hypothetical protein
METELRRFVRIWVAVSIVLLAAGALFDIVIDPYLVFGMPRIQTFNARKPAVDTQERLMKAYDVLRAKPNTLMLGSSRIDLGLDAKHPAWSPGDRPVYNLGFAAGSPYIAYRYLQHAMANHTPSLVVMGLEFEYFLAYPEDLGWRPESESRLAVTRDGAANSNRAWQRAQDIIEATLSLKALTDSMDTLAANFSGRSSDMVAGNWDWEFFRRITAGVGSLPLLAHVDLYDSSWYQGKRRDPLVMKDLQAIIDLCASRRIRLILFISPSHADELEIMDLAGSWQEFESWKREVLQMTTQRPANDPYKRVPLWDFSGYDAYSTESAPVDGETLHWFWEPAHYTRALGDVIVRRILGAGGGDWGELLSPENIGAHLATIRRQQRLYRDQHAADARRVRDFYDSVADMRKRALAKIQ